MPGDTTQTMQDALKYNYGSGVLNNVRKARQKRRIKMRALKNPARAHPQQNLERVRDAMRLKPWV